MIDGAKGLRKAVNKVFGDKAAVRRFQWHKRENVVGYLPISKQATFRQKLQRAYDQPTYAQSKVGVLTDSFGTEPVERFGGGQFG